MATSYVVNASKLRQQERIDVTGRQRWAASLRSGAQIGARPADRSRTQAL
jgi:hypothetical protein